MRSVCLIPARGGSKRVKRKNVRPLNGKPLLFYAVEAAHDSAAFDEVIVSTDDPQVRDLCLEAGYRCEQRRADLASDAATVFQVVAEFLERRAGDFETVAAMLPTCPFRTAAHVRGAMALYERHAGRASVVSVTAYDFPPQFGMSLTPTGDLHMRHPEAYGKSTRSQNMEPVFRPNGAIWISSVAAYLAQGTFYAGRLVGYEMDALSSFDIDHPYQLALAELVAERRAAGDPEFG